MSILTRIVKKARLWYRFFRISDNFFEIIWYRAINMLRLDSMFPYDAVIQLKTGEKIAYGTPMDLSAVPVVVEIWQEGMYEPDGYAIPRDGAVIDIGANVGCFGLYAAKRSEGKIYAFEPMPKNFALLERNIKLNGFNQITPIRAAVTAEDGEVTMHVSEVDTAHSVTHELFGEGKSMTVPSINIERFCKEKNVGPIGFMKMDCEGAENDIILGWSDEFAASIHTVVLEHHERYTHRDHNEIVIFLKKHGFTVLEYDEQYIAAKKQPKE